MAKASERAWRLLESGKDVETVREITGLSRKVLEGMLRDIERNRLRQCDQPADGRR